MSSPVKRNSEYCNEGFCIRDKVPDRTKRCLDTKS